jgi:hypothetical protein
MATRAGSAALLRSIDQRKRALEELIHVAQTVERLQQGLQAVLLLGASTSAIPRQSLQFYRGLDARLRGQPVRELSALLSGLEKAIRNDVGQILQLACIDDTTLLEQRDPGAGEAPDPTADVARLAGDFRRRVQTCVYLRVLLREQGVSTRALTLAVPTEQIRRQLAALEARARRCREKAVEEIHGLIEAVQRCLRDQTLPGAMGEGLRGVEAQLHSNLEHLQSGKPVDEMPFPVESFSLQAEATEAPPEMAGSSHGSAPEPAPRSQLRDAGVGADRSARPGLVRSLWLWCVTPTRVSWGAIRSGRYRPHSGSG